MFDLTLLNPSPFWLSTVDRPLGTNFFSPQISAVIKINGGGGHNFRYENTKYSLSKITPALQAIAVIPYG